MFKVYERYGLGVEVREEYGEDEKMRVDGEGLEVEMEKQGEGGRNGREDVGSMEVEGGGLGDIKAESRFVG
nr:hypothetical protein [Bacillus altitudinis]